MCQPCAMGNKGPSRAVARAGPSRATCPTMCILWLAGWLEWVVFVFEGGPADIDVVLELSPKDVGLISIYDPEEGSPDDWLYYSDQQDASGAVVLENIQLPEAEHYIWIRDVLNDGADYSLTISEVAP